MKIVLMAILGFVIGAGTAIFIVDPTMATILSGADEARFLIIWLGFIGAGVGGFLGTKL